MPSFAEIAESAVDGLNAADVAHRLSLPRVALFSSLPSTLDVAHEIAADGASSGTLIIADEQTAGRGRQGRKWASAPGAGAWLTLIERSVDINALDVLSLRCGLFAAEALDALAGSRVHVKWPNDLYVRERKLAGILIETRWRASAPEWIAIGFGVNVRTPDVDTAIGLPESVSRSRAIDCVIPALRAAARATGHLSPDELARWHSRDLASNRLVTEPATGTVRGISTDGALLIVAGSGTTAHRSGSLLFAQLQPCS